MSVASEAFRWALGELATWRSEPAERRPAFDVWSAPGHRGARRNGSAPAAGGPIAEASAAIEAGALTATELTEQALAAIEADNHRLHAFVAVLAAEARAEAAARDAELARGERRGPLHGIPVSVKDVIHVAGAPTRAGSAAYEERPSRDAWAVARLRAAGAVILGKTATHEFALGVTTPQSRNPHDDTRIPGGSSGGSGIAVATGMGLGSIGTDTRASIRVPAALCGVVGLKPTYGTVSTDGVVPLSWTMDHIGLIAARVADTACMLEALLEPTRPLSAAAGAPVSGMRVGVPAAAFDGADPEVAASVGAAIEGLRRAGVDVAEAERPGAGDFRGANAMGLLVSRCEAAAFHRALGADRGRYWAEVRDQLDAADRVLARDYIDAQRFRAELRDGMLAELDGLDALAMPTTPVAAPVAEDAEDYLTVLSRNAIPWSFVGFPAISVPCRPTPAGLPVGIQLVTRPHAEEVLVALGSALEAD